MNVECFFHGFTLQNKEAPNGEIPKDAFLFVIQWRFHQEESRGGEAL